MLYNDPSTLTNTEIGTLQFDLSDEEFDAVSAIAVLFRHEERGLCYVLLITPHADVPDPSQATIRMNPTDGIPLDTGKDVQVLEINPRAGKVYSCRRQDLDNGYTRFTIRFSVPEGLFIRTTCEGMRFDYYTAFTGTSGANNILQVDIRSTDLEGLTSFSIHFSRNDFTELFAEVMCDEGQKMFNLDRMQVLVLPDALTAIGDEAFEKLACEAVIIPGNCTSVGNRAFRNCRNLKYVRIPAHLEIPEDAFEGCGNVAIERVPGE